jgi:hypothetical protein
VASLATIESQPITTTPPELEPLPEGWTEVISRSQKAVFYHNKLTSETSWVRPRATPVVEEVIEDRPVTPPPTGAQTTFTGPKITSGSGLPSKPAPNVLKQERPPPTGPGGGKSDYGRGPVKSDDQASPAVDPVQSAYARRTAGRADQRNVPAPVRPEERGTKRSPSPRREDPKRSRMDDPPRMFTSALRCRQSRIPICFTQQESLARSCRAGLYCCFGIWMDSVYERMLTSLFSII